MNTFVVGQLYSRQLDLHAQFGGQSRGGISTPREHPFILLFTGGSGAAHGYDDGWENETYLFFGEGQRGDMQFAGGNRAIRDHARDGKALHLFQTQGSGRPVRYMGQFACSGIELRESRDTEGSNRQAIVFRLQTIADAPIGNEPASGEDLGVLRERAMNAAVVGPSAKATAVNRTIYERARDVRAYVLARAAGQCEACGAAAPFDRPDGTPYLEPHHTHMISEGGPDHPRWVAAVCPNCHREIHYGRRGVERNASLCEYLKYIEKNSFRG